MTSREFLQLDVLPLLWTRGQGSQSGQSGQRRGREHHRGVEESGVSEVLGSQGQGSRKYFLDAILN